MEFISNPKYSHALILSVISGLSTTLGGLVVLLLGNPTPRTSGLVLGFASGVMLFVSLFDLIPESFEKIGNPLVVGIAFIIGAILMHFIVKLIPDLSDHYALHDSFDNEKIHTDSKLLSMGLVVVAGISIHNFPEGMAVFLSTLNTWKLGITIAIAIGLHNFPEGMAVAAPIYAATNSRLTALKWCLISGLCEPAGALLFGLVFHKFMDIYAVSCMLAGVSGVMVYVCMKELIPNSLRYSGVKNTIAANVLGSAVLFLCSRLLSMYG